MKKIITGLMVLASTQFAMATATPITKIKDIYVYANYTVLKMENTHANVDSCTSSKATEFLYIDTAATGGNRMYSALLSAYVAKQKVRLGYSSCVAWGSNTIPKAYNVTLVP